MVNKIFAERLNAELDSMELPTGLTERRAAVARWLKLPSFKVDSMLAGNLPDKLTLQKIADELDVTVEWLAGLQEKKHQ